MGELIAAAVTLVLGLLFLVLGVAVYFIPWVAALWNRHPDDKAIGLLNLFLGWTFIGWVVALVWAYKKPAAAKP